MRILGYGLLPIAVAAFLGASCAAATPQPGDGPAKIPFTLFQSNIVVQTQLGQAPAMPFIFDSGLSHGNIVSKATAQLLNLEPSGAAHVTDASGRHSALRVAKIDRVEVGDVVLRDQKFAIVHVPGPLKNRPGEPPIAGFLGAPLMQGAVLCVDYADQMLRRWAPSEFDPAGLAAIPAHLNHGLVTIDIVVDGLPATVAVDTGNDGGVQLFPAFYHKHDLRSHYSDLQPVGAVTGSGARFRALRATARQVRVGQTELEGVPLLFSAQAFDPAWGIDGLVGYRFLSRLNPCISRPKSRFLWDAS
ncbi:MAG: retropepsin-like domain-containing protein [Salinisphaera sp.]|nr:retropepsin-like domain-containing protein [Salinisphaera sp.]